MWRRAEKRKSLLEATSKGAGQDPWNGHRAAVVGRIAELSTLQTIGFVRRAVLVSLLQEGVLLAAAASLLAALIALIFVNGAAVRFTMGAFVLCIDSPALLSGCGVGLLLGVFGAIPPAIRALRMPIVEGLRAV